MQCLSKGESTERVCMPGIFIPDLEYRNFIYLFIEYYLTQQYVVNCLYKYQQMGVGKIHRAYEQTRKPLQYTL